MMVLSILLAMVLLQIIDGQINYEFNRRLWPKNNYDSPKPAPLCADYIDVVITMEEGSDIVNFDIQTNRLISWISIGFPPLSSYYDTNIDTNDGYRIVIENDSVTEYNCESEECSAQILQDLTVINATTIDDIKYIEFFRNRQGESNDFEFLDPSNYITPNCLPLLIVGAMGLDNELFLVNTNGNASLTVNSFVYMYDVSIKFNATFRGDYQFAPILAMPTTNDPVLATNFGVPDMFDARITFSINDITEEVYIILSQNYDQDPGSGILYEQDWQGLSFFEDRVERIRYSNYTLSDMETYYGVYLIRNDRSFAIICAISTALQVSWLDGATCASVITTNGGLECLALHSNPNILNSVEAFVGDNYVWNITLPTKACGYHFNKWEFLTCRPQIWEYAKKEPGASPCRNVRSSSTDAHYLSYIEQISYRTDAPTMVPTGSPTPAPILPRVKYMLQSGAIEFEISGDVPERKNVSINIFIDLDQNMTINIDSAYFYTYTILFTDHDMFAGVPNMATVPTILSGNATFGYIISPYLPDNAPSFVFEIITNISDGGELRPGIFEQNSVITDYETDFNTFTRFVINRAASNEEDRLDFNFLDFNNLANEIYFCYVSSPRIYQFNTGTSAVLAPEGDVGITPYQSSCLPNDNSCFGCQPIQFDGNYQIETEFTQFFENKNITLHLIYDPFEPMLIGKLIKPKDNWVIIGSFFDGSTSVDGAGANSWIFTTSTDGGGNTNTVRSVIEIPDVNTGQMGYSDEAISNYDVSFEDIDANTHAIYFNTTDSLDLRNFGWDSVRFLTETVMNVSLIVSQNGDNSPSTSDFPANILLFRLLLILQFNTDSPTMAPSVSPSLSPSKSPSTTPSESPSMTPSMTPSITPTTEPTTSPSELPSIIQAVLPTGSPTTNESKTIVHFHMFTIILSIMYILLLQM